MSREDLRAVAQTGLKYLVITSVDETTANGGAQHCNVITEFAN